MTFTISNTYTTNGLSSLILTALFVLAGMIPLAAQDSTEADTSIVSKEVVISSSRIPQTAAGSGRNITIVPGKMINELPAQTTDQALRYVPGVEVQSRGAFGVQSDFSLRGSTFSQVLVLVDGMRINDPLTAHFNGYIPVAPAEIQKIEVLRGPAAAQYGADAVGGVINIITKTFSATGSRDVTSANAEIGYGQNDLKLAKAGFFSQAGSSRLGIGGMWHASPGQQLTSDYKNRFSIGNISASGGVKLNERWDIALRSGFDYRDFNARYFYTASPFDDASETVKAWWNQMRLQRTAENSTTTIKGAFKQNSDSYVFNPQTQANEHTTTLASLQLNQYRQLSSEWDLSYGLQSSNRTIESTDRGDHNDWHYAAYTMVQWQPTNPFTISGSLRLDHDENYGTELMPQLSMSYQEENWILRGAAGRSVRAPSYTERFISTNLQGPLTGGRNLGNPWLEAERAWSGELGSDFFVSPNIRLSATGFIRKSSNLIDYVLTNSSQIQNDDNLQANTDYLYSQNINEVTSAGLETELSASRNLGAVWQLNSTLGYTFTDFFGNEDVAGKYLSTYARHLVNGSLRMNYKDFGAMIAGVWKQRDSDRSSAIGAFKSSSYSVWNVKLNYQLGSNFALSMHVNNVFDTDYQDVLGARMPGRWTYGTLQWQL